MRRIPALLAFAAVLAVPLVGPAHAVNGSRQPAGGAHMSSYVRHHSHDPRSLHSQRRGHGQIQGAPQLSENAGVRGKPRKRPSPHWSAAWPHRIAR